MIYHKFILLFGAGIVFCLSGCLATQKVVDEAFAEVRAFNSETRGLVDRTRSQLSMTQGLTQRQLDDANAALNVVVKAADATDATLNDIEERLEPLLTADDLPSAIQGIGTILAPLTGPMAPWILLATNLLSVGITRRRTRTTTTNHLIAPMEASRDRNLEFNINDPAAIYVDSAESKEKILKRIEKFNDDAKRDAPKGNFIVLNQDILAPAHAANGAAALIKKATT